MEPSASITIPATPDGLDRATGVIAERTTALGGDARARFASELAIEEMVGNIIRYGTTGAGGAPSITISTAHERDRLIIRIEDTGPEFDPTAHVDPDRPAGSEDVPDGGRGIMMVRRTVESMTHDRRHDRNVLTLVVPLTPSARGAASAADDR